MRRTRSKSWDALVAAGSAYGITPAECWRSISLGSRPA
jgi:hypothetical protein